MNQQSTSQVQCVNHCATEPHLQTFTLASWQCLNMDEYWIIFTRTIPKNVCRQAYVNVMSLKQHSIYNAKTKLNIQASTQSISNHYFFVCQKLTRELGQLSLPHVGITETERNRTDIKTDA